MSVSWYPYNWLPILQYIMYTKWKKELQNIMANSKTQQQQNKKANIEINVRTWNQTRDTNIFFMHI